METALVTHVVLFCLSDAYFCPLRKDKSYNRLFIKNFPLISIISVLSFVFSLAYLFISDWIFTANYIDSFCNSKIGFIAAIYTVIIFVLTLFVVGKEMYNASSEAKNAKFLLIPVVILFLYTSSVVWSAIIINCTNSVLDFSKGEKHVSKIYSGRTTTTNKEYKTKIYYLDVKPDICGRHSIEVSRSVFDKVKKLSKYEPNPYSQNSENTIIVFYDEPKLEVYVYKGLYGVRYIGKSMDVTKDSSVSPDIFPKPIDLKDYSTQSDNFPGIIPLKK
ncbi:MAG: hypothetical protein IKP71_01685 [Candidatus Riflebacteria bacterium]|nr:hypothetical protein [Candidatus Riflebacteria bacterium]